jgi:hypothetical protein
MNRILYSLIGGCVAGVIALAFFQKRNIGSSTDVVATFVFLSVLAAATCILLYSRCGRRLSSRIQQKAIEEDERLHSNARTKGGGTHATSWSPALRHRLLVLGRKVSDHSASRDGRSSRRHYRHERTFP